MERRWFNGRQESGIRDKQQFDKEEVANSSISVLVFVWDGYVSIGLLFEWLL